MLLIYSQIVEKELMLYFYRLLRKGNYIMNAPMVDF